MEHTVRGILGGALRPMLSALIAVLALASSAAAQPVADHLTCYKVKDPQAKVSYTADLGGLVAEPGCQIKVPAVMTCVPSTKTNVRPTPPGSGATGTPNAFGCYQVKCPKVTLPALQLNDQFGQRGVTPTTPRLLCAPAAPPTPTCVNAELVCTCGDNITICDFGGEAGTCPCTFPSCADTCTGNARSLCESLCASHGGSGTCAQQACTECGTGQQCQ